MHDAAAELLATPGFVEKLKSGDREAIGILFRECAGEMMNFLKKKRHQHGCPEQEWADVVQDVFVKFLHKPPTLQPHRPALPYLKTCALRRAQDRVKAAKARRRHERQAMAERTEVIPGITSSKLEITEVVAMIEAKLGGMKPNDQVAIRTFMESDPNRHVATLAMRSGVEIGTAQMRFSRALRRLRAEMKLNEKQIGGLS
ncbi:MAG: sigma-70 family RNA polymerase sigma factor [Planctomycetaceae bacterium]|nr:sigma-70 family RNA polymerase sigma factor [Planctomycetaceae bacterium]